MLWVPRRITSTLLRKGRARFRRSRSGSSRATGRTPKSPFKLFEHDLQIQVRHSETSNVSLEPDPERLRERARQGGQAVEALYGVQTGMLQGLEVDNKVRNVPDSRKKHLLAPLSRASGACGADGWEGKPGGRARSGKWSPPKAVTMFSAQAP